MSSGINSIYSQDNINLPNAGNGGVYEFDRFRLDGARLMLYENFAPVALAPKVIETLLALVERHGEVISKNELMNRLWADSFVEESNLTQNIYLLRKTLGKASDGRDFVETFRRRGYRFNGEIKPAAKNFGTAQTNFAAEESVETESVPETPPLIIEKPTAISGSSARNYSVGAGLIIIALLAAFGWSRFSNRQNAAVISSQNIRFKRLTSDVHAYNPAISPDGKYVAYALIENDRAGLWLKDLATGGATQILPSTDEGYKGLQFSPNGEWIYYLSSRKNSPNQIVARVQAFGGTPQEISSNVISPPAISPDGKQIAFVRGHSLLVADAEKGGAAERVIAERGDGKRGFVAWDSQMSWSPDGTRLAVCQERRENESRFAELIEIAVADGSEKLIKTPAWNEIDDAAWLPDGNGLLVTVKESPTAAYQIWHLPYPAGEPIKITNDLFGYDWLSVSADGKRIVAEQMLGNRNIWLWSDSKTEQLTSGGAADNGSFGIALAPGGEIIYTSPRSGNVDLWLMNGDGSGQKQLTQNAGTYNGKPAVTPDGRFIVFCSNRSGSYKLWRMELSGANPMRLTAEENEERQPDISPDGAWVFYARHTEKTAAIWKVPIEGGTPVRLSADDYAWLPISSPDGNLVAYQFYEDAAANPWKTRVMNVADGKPLDLPELPATRVLSWTRDSKNLIYANAYALNLLEQPLAGGEPRQITNFNSERIANFAASADGKRIVVSRGGGSTEAVLISNFLSE